MTPVANRPFRLQVVDRATGRGIPLVELTTVHDVLYVTDSAGVAAIDEPALRGRVVWLDVRSHGYEIDEDSFGFHGTRVRLESGGSKVVEMKRLNVAERLYRITGVDVYGHSVRLGEPAPIREPLMNGGVMGQDSVMNAIYRGRLFWFWGDTARSFYPLGNLAASGGVSKLPEQGGLDPAVGVNLDYFVNDRGLARKMCPLEGRGAVWLDGVMVVDVDGRERMLAHYQRMKRLGVRREHGLAVWSDEREVFEKLEEFPLDAPIHPGGHPVLVDEEGEEWFYFPAPFATVRVRARIDHVTDLSRYEAFTPLQTGSRWKTFDPPLERDRGGRLVWGWKRDTAPLSRENWNNLIGRELVGPEERWNHPTDVETGDPIQIHSSSIAWNAHRQRWVMIALQERGRSLVGEVWYLESESLLGPWRSARRIVTHDDYSFYNPKQHPYFAQEGGRIIYFEGTYSSRFAKGRPTPRYDYNQIMYRLDLDDPRLDAAQLDPARVLDVARLP